MNADQIAEIRPALREVVAGAPDICATLEVEGDADRWIQIVDRQINCAYPHSDDPEERVLRLALPAMRLELVGWEAGKFATFEVAQIEVNVAAEWIDAYLVGVLGCEEGEYHLDVRFERV